MRYTSLLEDLQKAITFVQETLNPVLDSLTVEEREFSLRLLNRECDILLSEVDRLERERSMQERRLDNAMHLVCGSFYVHIQVNKGELGFQQHKYLGQQADAENDADFGER